MPDWVAERFEGLEDDPETHALVASAVAAEQVLELVDDGVTEFHFLTLNRSNLVLALARLLGVRPDQADVQPAFRTTPACLKSWPVFTVWPCFTPPSSVGAGVLSERIQQMNSTRKSPGALLGQALQWFWPSRRPTT